MYYIVQNNLFREEGLEKLMAALKKFELPHELVEVVPLVDDIAFETDRKDVFAFGSMKMARVSRKFGWNPGAAMDERFDFEVYSQHYQDHLLNHDSLVVAFGDEFSWGGGERFIRPCLDTKTFTGRVFVQAEWKPFVAKMIADPVSSLTAETMIQVATPKKIYLEARTWIIGGRVVTQSIYRRGGAVVYDAHVDPAAIDFANRMAAIFQLGPAFTMDVCLTDAGWKIVECGSVSCAGFYASDVQKILLALEEEYGSR